MNSLDERIAQFRKMAQDDPENELGHYRLGQLLMEGQHHEEAIASFKRTLELSPHFSKVYSLLSQCQRALGHNEEALATALHGYKVASERGDNMPRDEMGKLIVELGGTIPTAPTPARAPAVPGVGGFQCQRPTCRQGSQARQLPKPPTNDDDGRKIYATVCAECWTDWLKNYSIKVINELRLDLSTERGQAEYDRYMREFLGLDEAQPTTSLPQA